MAQTIATIALIISIIVLQHLYNWAMRKLFDLDDDSAPVFILAASGAMIGLTYILFTLLLEINK